MIRERVRMVSRRGCLWLLAIAMALSPIASTLFFGMSTNAAVAPSQTLNLTDIREVRDTSYTAQQGIVFDGQNVYVLKTRDGNDLKIVKADFTTGRQTASKTYANLTHANASGYSSKDNRIYVVSNDYNKLISFDTSLNIVNRSVNVDQSSGGAVCYDATNNRWLLGSIGAGYSIVDGSLKNPRKIITAAEAGKNVPSLLNAGTACDSQHIYIIRSTAGGGDAEKNLVMVYDWSGKSIASYYINPLKQGRKIELEGGFVDKSGNLWVGYNDFGDGTDVDGFAKVEGMGSSAGYDCHDDNDFFATNDVNFFSECGCSSGVDGLALTGNAAASDSSGYAGAVFKFLISNNFVKNGNKPMTAVQAAGALGNFFQESRINPKAIQSGQGYDDGKAKSGAGGYGFGLAQWDGGRRQNLLKYAAEQSKSWDDIDLQLAFIKHELDTTGEGDYVFEDAEFTGATDPAVAAYRFMQDYERAGVPNQAVRDEAAKKYYAQYKDLAPGSTISGDGTACAGGVGAGSAGVRPNFPDKWKTTKGEDYSNIGCAAGTTQTEPGTKIWGDVKVSAEGTYTNMVGTTVRVCSVTGEKGVFTSSLISGDVVQLLADAQAAGNNLHIGNSLRTSEQQAHLRTVNGCPDVDKSPSSSCRVPTARPGSSLHETGLALDLTCTGGLAKGSKCRSWLDTNAAKYGFYNLPSENWHWSTSGG